MDVRYVGDTKTVKSTKGEDVKIEKGGSYTCMEKEYHSGLFVRMALPSGAHVKVKRAELEKI